jgi:hypothetical protein
MTFSANFFTKAERTQTDFVSSFYIAGYIVSHKKAHDLYPEINATSFKDGAFDRICRELLPDFPKDKTGIYMYSPLLALLFSPFAQMSFTNALTLFQALSVLSLLIAAMLIKRMCSVNISIISIFSLFFLFLPIAQTLWIGQLAIIFALLPLVFGWYLLEINKPFLAGLIWSIVFLKLQLFPLMMVLVFISFLLKQYKCLLGFLIGSISLILISFLCLSPEVFGQWLASFKHSEHLISGGSCTSPEYLTACLPGAIMYLLPDYLRNEYKWLIYGFCSIFILVNIYLASQICKKQLALKTKLRLCLLISVLAMPLYIPRLLIYDLVLYVLPAALFLLDNNSNLNYMKLLVSIYGLLISWQVFLIVVNTSQAHPITLLIGLLFIICCLFYHVYKVSTTMHQYSEHI